MFGSLHFDEFRLFESGLGRRKKSLTQVSCSQAVGGEEGRHVLRNDGAEKRGGIPDSSNLCELQVVDCAELWWKQKCETVTSRHHRSTEAAGQAG